MENLKLYVSNKVEVYYYIGEALAIRVSKWLTINDKLQNAQL